MGDETAMRHKEASRLVAQPSPALAALMIVMSRASMSDESRLRIRPVGWRWKYEMGAERSLSTIVPWTALLARLVQLMRLLDTRAAARVRLHVADETNSCGLTCEDALGASEAKVAP